MPPGHITEVIRDLERWKRNRQRKGLEVRLLERTIAYMEEYRELVGARRTWHDIEEEAARG